MNNYIIIEPVRELRFQAREALRGKWKPAIGAFFIVTLCISVVPELIGTIFGYNDAMEFIGSIYTLLITGPFTFGMTLYALKITRRKNVSSTLMFSGFERFIKTFGLMLFIALFTILWSLLLIIPGIIAALRYSMAYYVMIDHPEYSIRECVNESKRMMKGNKWRLFCVEFSFIGWGFVAVLAAALAGVLVILPLALSDAALMGTASMSSMNALASMLLVFVAALIISPLQAYMQTTVATFYNIMKVNNDGFRLSEEEVA